MVADFVMDARRRGAVTSSGFEGEGAEWRARNPVKWRAFSAPSGYAMVISATRGPKHHECTQRVSLLEPQFTSAAAS